MKGCTVAKSLLIVESVAADLGRRVRTVLAGLHVPSFRHINIETAGDAVILTGRVGSFHERQLAIACCKRVAGVRQVDDRLQVLGAIGEPLATAK